MTRKVYTPSGSCPVCIIALIISSASARSICSVISMLRLTGLPVLSYKASVERFRSIFDICIGAPSLRGSIVSNLTKVTLFTFKASESMIISNSMCTSTTSGASPLRSSVARKIGIFDSPVLISTILK